MPLRTVKGIPRLDRKSGLTDAFVQQIWATIDSPPHGSPHFRRVPVAISSYLDAVVGVHRGAYNRRTPSGKARGRGNGNWGGWGFEGQIRLA